MNNLPTPIVTEVELTEALIRAGREVEALRAQISEQDARIAELEAEIIARKGLCDAQKHMNGMFRAQIDMFTDDVIKADAIDDALKLGMIDRLCKATQKHHDRDTEMIKKQEEWVADKFGRM